MSIAHGLAFEGDDAAALEDAVKDGLGEVLVVQGGAPVLEGFLSVVKGMERRRTWRSLTTWKRR